MIQVRGVAMIQGRSQRSTWLRGLTRDRLYEQIGPLGAQFRRNATVPVRAARRARARAQQARARRSETVNAPSLSRQHRPPGRSSVAHQLGERLVSLVDQAENVLLVGKGRGVEFEQVRRIARDGPTDALGPKRDTPGIQDTLWFDDAAGLDCVPGANRPVDVGVASRPDRDNDDSDAEYF